MVREDHQFDGHNDSDRSSEAIEKDVRRNRDEMDRTLDELGRRLEPGRLIHDVWDTLRERIPGGPEAADAARNAGAGIVRQISKHPVPTAIIGAGLLWLIVEETRGRDSHADAGELGDKISDTGHDISQRAHSAAESTRDAFGRTTQHIGEMGRQGISSVRNAAHTVQEKAHVVSKRAAGTYEEHPLSVALAAMGVGLLAGVATPNTPVENRMMGPSADRFRKRASEMAEDAAGDMIESATDAMDEDSAGASRHSEHESEM